MTEKIVKDITKDRSWEVYMLPRADLNIKTDNSCNNWSCCSWRRQRPKSPVSETVEIDEKVHAVYHTNRPPEIQITHLEVRTPTPMRETKLKV